MVCAWDQTLIQYRLEGVKKLSTLFIEAAIFFCAPVLDGNAINGRRGVVAGVKTS